MEKRIQDREIDVDKVLKCLDNAIETLYNHDSYLLDIESDIDAKELYDVRNNQDHVGERSAAHKLALYLQREIDNLYGENKFDVDCEYNRDINKVKMMDDDAIIPDIIVHKRGNNNENLLVIELKTYWNTDIRKDIDKLRYLTSEEHQYKYAVGVSLILGRTIKDYKVVKVNNGKVKKS